MRFEVFTAVRSHVLDFRIVICSVVDGAEHFGGTYSLRILTVPCYNPVNQSEYRLYTLFTVCD